MSALEHRRERERMPVAGLPLGLWSRTTIASIAGHAGASGNAFCKPFSRPVGRGHEIHVLTDILERPAVIQLTPGNVSDLRIADALIEAAGPIRRLIADRGYDANRLRLTLRSIGTIPAQGDGHANVRSAHEERRYVIAGGSKLPSVA